MAMEAAPHQQALMAMTHMDVKEKANWFEALTAIIGAEIEMANKYEIYDKNTGQQVFFAGEQTDCIRRQLKSCCPDCVSWDVDIIYMPTQTKVYKLSRPWTCTCCCFNRPTMTLEDVTKNQVVGTLRDPFHCCNYTLDIMDPSGNNVIRADGGCCQWGLCCPLPCGPCAEVHFPLMDSARGKSVGNIQKKVPSCLKWCFASDVDNYHVEFGAVENPDYKALLMALSIFIDFRFFNDNSNDDQGGVLGAVMDS
jgi:hypothetical protein